MAEGPRHAGEPRVPQIASARRGSVVTGEPFARLLIYLLALERGDTSTLRGAPAPVPAWHPVTREAAEPLSLSLSLSSPLCGTAGTRISFAGNLLPTIRFPPPPAPVSYPRLSTRSYLADTMQHLCYVRLFPSRA